MNPKKFQSDLLAWYHKHKRALPFRATREPYRIWLSEVMAQQTTLNAVLPYFEKFTKRFPSLKDVAEASEAELLTYWQGLGYYSRVRNFQKACQHVDTHLGGLLPRFAAELLKLPGVGPYTAAAVASICFDEPVAVVDGNVKRVLARLYWYDLDPGTTAAKRFFDETANTLLDRAQPGDFNQAVMELGALVCRPKSPQCLLCPVRAHCAAFSKNPEAVPLRKKTTLIPVTYHALLVAKNGELLLKKPTPQNLIANTWELPSVYDSNAPFVDWQKNFGKTLQAQKIGSVKHGITNRKITVDVYKASTPVLNFDSQNFDYVAVSKLSELPVNTIAKKIITTYANVT